MNVLMRFFWTSGCKDIIIRPNHGSEFFCAGAQVLSQCNGYITQFNINETGMLNTVYSSFFCGEHDD